MVNKIDTKKEILNNEVSISVLNKIKKRLLYEGMIHPVSAVLIGNRK
jgi:hypothetical protein